MKFGDQVRIRCNVPIEGQCYLMDQKGELVWYRTDTAPTGAKFSFVIKGERKFHLGQSLRHETPFAISSSIRYNDYIS